MMRVISYRACIKSGHPAWRLIWRVIFLAFPQHLPISSDNSRSHHPIEHTVRKRGCRKLAIMLHIEARLPRFTKTLGTSPHDGN